MITRSAACARLIATTLVTLSIAAASACQAMTIPGAKQLADGVSVTLSSKVITYTSTDYFYLQEPNHGVSLCNVPAGGIHVRKTAHGLAVGACINASGIMRTNDKAERYLDCTSVTTAEGIGTVVPWMTANRALIDGPNTTGLLVRTTGVVNCVDPAGAFAYLDDGSYLADGNTLAPGSESVPGVRVALAGGLTAKVSSYVAVIGVSSLDSVSGSTARVILARSIDRQDAWAPILDMDMLRVPGGDFLMGNLGSGDDAVDGYPREYPQHQVHVAALWISRREITRGQYRQFVQAGGYSNPAYWSGDGWLWKTTVGRSQPDYWADTQTWEERLRPDVAVPTFTQTDSSPIVGVSYYEAEAFCRWAGGRLPTEAEWEKAARWDGSPRIYPWGNTMDKSLLNDWYDTICTGFRTAVTSYSAGASPCGCLNMAGNVWEWTQDWYRSYPGSDTSFDRTGTARSVRGGGWYGVYGARCASRWFAAPNTTRNDIGFRLAR